MKKNSANFLFEKELNWDAAGAGIKRQIMGFDNELMLVKITFEKGAAGALHSHPHTQSSYIASGVFEVEINSQKQILKAGDGFYAEPNAIHGLTCIEPGVVIDTFAPMREDFL